MEHLLLYLFKSSALLIIFYLAYLILLKKETFFELNRKFLIGGLIGSAILPAIYFTRTVYIEAVPVMASYSSSDLVNTTLVEQNSIKWWEIGGYIYLVISGFFLLRFCMQLILVFKILFSGESFYKNGIRYIETDRDQLPFSFFNYVVYNPLKHDRKDLELILQHEKIHARQYHSLDILIGNLAQCLLWFNPLCWFYKKSIEQNLEFIADRLVVEQHDQLKDYQHALVKVSVADLNPALTNHFYQSFIKKRILMLNKKSSNNSPAWKLGIIAPFIFGFLLFCNVKTEAMIVQQEKPKEKTEKIDAPITSGALSAHITKKTTKSELQELQEEFASHGVKLKFQHLKYSPEGNIIRVDISVKNIKNENKGSLSPRNPNGIKPIDIVIFENGGIYLGSKNSEMEETKANSGNRKLKIIDHASIPQQDEPIVILNGIPQKDRSKLDSINSSSIENITVLKGPKVTALYGTRGSNGAIIVSTKINHKKDSQIEIKKNVSVSDSVGNPNRDIYAYEYGKNIKQILLRDPENEKPLLIIDGQVKGKDFDLNHILLEDITSIKVLKGNNATDKYGKKGKSGAIEIFTKSSGYKTEKKKSDVIIFQVTKTKTDSDLEVLKHKILKSTGMKISFSEIKRNTKNEITHIQLSGEKEGRKASGVWTSMEGGISPIIIGLTGDGTIFIRTK